jgi:hypothetical protein
LKKNNNTIGLSQEPYLLDYEGWDSYIEEKLLKNMKMKSRKDKLSVEVKAYNGPILLVHDTFWDIIRYNRPRMDSATKGFDQQLMLGRESLSCLETEEEKNEPKVS